MDYINHGITIQVVLRISPIIVLLMPFIKVTKKRESYGTGSNRILLQVPAMTILEIEQDFDKFALTYFPPGFETPYNLTIIRE